MTITEQLGSLKLFLQCEADNPVTLDESTFQGVFADKLLEHLADYQSEAEKMATAAAELVKIKAEQDKADAALAAAPSEADVAAAYDKYLDSFDDEDADPSETRRLKQEWLDLKQERDKAVEDHRKKSEELTRRYKEAMEGIGGKDYGDWDSTEGDGSDEGKPKGTGDFDSDDASKRQMSESDFDNLMGGGETPSGETQLSSDTPTTAAPTSAMMPTQQQPATSPAAMPTAAQTPAFSPSPSVNPQRKDKDKSKDKEKEFEPLPLPGVVTSSSAPLDRGSSTTGTTTKDVSGKGGTIGLTNAAPGASTSSTGGNPRGGGMVGGMPMGGHGAPIGAGGKSTTAAGSKILDADRTLTRRVDGDVSISGGTVSRDVLDIAEKQAAEEEDEIRRLNTAADKRKAS